MQDVLPEGGVIRKLWVGEAAKYRDHVLRLDPESRSNRFAGGVSDEFIRNYVDLNVSLDTVVHGFFIGGMMRGAAELRPLGVRFPRQAEAAISVEKPWLSVISSCISDIGVGRDDSTSPTTLPKSNDNSASNLRASCCMRWFSARHAMCNRRKPRLRAASSVRRSSAEPTP